MRQLFTNYGMAIVLVLLCVYYSFATIDDVNPQGAAAGNQVAALVSAKAPKGDVLVLASEGDDDKAFALAAETELKAKGYNVVGVVLGTPRAFKQGLIAAAEGGKKLVAIAATKTVADLTVIENRTDKSAEVFAPASYRYSTFLQKANLLNVASQITVTAVLAVGMTLVILTGGIDLSVGSLIAVSSVITALIIQRHGGSNASAATMAGAGAFGVLVCGAIGAFSGSMVTFFRVPPFIVTLAIMQVGRGLAFKLTRAQSIGSLPPGLTWLGQGMTLGIPNAVIMMAIVFGLAWVFTTKMKIGRYIYAVGGNAEAARLSGVRVGGILILVYALSGMFAGLGGFLVTSQLGSGDPKYGDSAELYAIAAVVVGGTSLSGGSGRILGTLIGAFIIGVIKNGMNLTRIDSYNQMIVLGFVILGAVLLDLLKSRNWSLPRWMKPVPKA